MFFVNLEHKFGLNINLILIIQSYIEMFLFLGVSIKCLNCSDLCLFFFALSIRVWLNCYHFLLYCHFLFYWDL